MNIYEEVKSTLKQRQDKLLDINNQVDMLTGLNRTLLESLQTLLRHTPNPLSYDDRKNLKKRTEELVNGINNELEIQNRMMDEQE
tara:strand:- start:946 stop:1200 length:255 start_codon:yes stop_codon:yes gene_type:complete